MITAQQLKTITPGDVIEAGCLFHGVTNEPVVWVCCSTQALGVVDVSVKFKLVYFNIALGYMTAVTRNGEVTWEALHD